MMWNLFAGREEEVLVLKNSSSKMVSCEGDQRTTEQKLVSNILCDLSWMFDIALNCAS